MKKKNKVSFVLLICGTLITLLSLVLGLVFANTSKHVYKVKDIDVVINSESDECYSISIDISLQNKTGTKEGGSITLLLEDQHGKRINASFGSVDDFEGKKQLENLTNSSVVTKSTDSTNGLDYNIKVVGVTIGSQKYDERVTFNRFFGIPMLVGAIVVVLSFVIKEDKKQTEEVA